MDVPPLRTSTIVVTKSRTLKNGTKKYYTCNRTYELKGRENCGRKCNLTDEQKAEIIRKKNEGVTTKRLCEEYKISYGAIKKILK